MAIVGIYKIALTNAKLGLTKEVMANKVRFTFAYSIIIIGFCIGCIANLILSTTWKELFTAHCCAILQIGSILMPVRIRILLDPPFFRAD
jgi:hypothetical protein